MDYSCAFLDFNTGTLLPSCCSVIVNYFTEYYWVIDVLFVQTFLHVL